MEMAENRIINYQTLAVNDVNCKKKAFIVIK